MGQNGGVQKWGPGPFWGPGCQILASCSIKMGQRTPKWPLLKVPFWVILAILGSGGGLWGVVLGGFSPKWPFWPFWDPGAKGPTGPGGEGSRGRPPGDPQNTPKLTQNDPHFGVQNGSFWGWDGRFKGVFGASGPRWPRAPKTGPRPGPQKWGPGRGSLIRGYNVNYKVERGLRRGTKKWALLDPPKVSDGTPGHRGATPPPQAGPPGLRCPFGFRRRLENPSDFPGLPARPPRTLTAISTGNGPLFGPYLQENKRKYVKEKGPPAPRLTRRAFGPPGRPPGASNEKSLF